MRMKGERLRKRLQFRVDNRQKLTEKEEKDLAFFTEMKQRWDEHDREVAKEKSMKYDFEFTDDELKESPF